MKKASKARIIIILLLLLFLCACGNKEKAVESPNVSAEPSMETTGTPDTKEENPAETIEIPNADTEDSEQETEIPDIGAEEPVETSTPSDAEEEAPVETPETPEPKSADKEEVSEPSTSSNQEEAVLYWTFTESAPNLDIVGHYADDWGFPVSFTIYVESGTVKDFCIVSFDWAEDSEDGIMFGVDKILQNIGDLTAGQGVVIEACLGEMLPGTGFAYTDQDGSTHVYSFAESGEDGSIRITEDMIRQEY